MVEWLQAEPGEELPWLNGCRQSLERSFHGCRVAGRAWRVSYSMVEGLQAEPGE